MRRSFGHSVLIYIMLMLFGTAPLSARPITEDKACAIATKFYYMKTMGDEVAKVTSLQGLDLVYSPLHGTVERYTAPEYYIFAPSNGKGFVIVAGDDRASQLIVGYSLDGAIGLPLSTSLQGYLNCYVGYIAGLYLNRFDIIKCYIGVHYSAGLSRRVVPDECAYFYKRA